MTRCSLKLLGALLTAVLTGPLTAAEELQTCPYFPLKVGTTWTYRVNKDKQIITQVTKYEEVEGVRCAQLVSLMDGDEVASEHIAPGKDGVYRYSFRGEKSNAPFKPDVPIRFLMLPPKSGESWKVSFKIGEVSGSGTFTMGEETVEVKAGKYKTVTSKAENFEIGKKKATFTYYFAEGVGMVKQVVKVDGKELVFELEEFGDPANPPKEKPDDNP